MWSSASATKVSHNLDKLYEVDRGVGLHTALRLTALGSTAAAGRVGCRLAGCLPVPWQGLGDTGTPEQVNTRALHCQQDFSCLWLRLRAA